MPFCRKCGRRLPPYSENCPDCKTSTTAPIIKIKKTSENNNKFKAPEKTKIAKAVLPTKTTPTQTNAPAKPAKTKTVIPDAITEFASPARIDKAGNPTKLAPIKFSTKHIISAKAAKKAILQAPAKIIASAEPPREVIQVIRFTQAAQAKVTANNQVSPSKAPPTKPVVPELTRHQIKQSKLSLEEDIITNPYDYETQSFGFDLKCPHGHFWQAGTALPISKGKAYCPECGERLRKPLPKGKKRYRTVGA